MPQGVIDGLVVGAMSTGLAWGSVKVVQIWKPDFEILGGTGFYVGLFLGNFLFHAVLKSWL